MILADILTPVSIVIEFLIVVVGCYAGAVLKKPAGYLFALTFLLFALYDYFTIIGFSADLISVINIIAVLSALGGIAVFARKT